MFQMEISRRFQFLLFWKEAISLRDADPKSPLPYHSVRSNRPQRQVPFNPQSWSVR
ncbi:hypothetical protein BCEP4_1220050 [Burkholderia cepacia]|nr:hypothetical protein BCEP4_1220050 [Burkholderia cepacia]